MDLISKLYTILLLLCLVFIAGSCKPDAITPGSICGPNHVPSNHPRAAAYQAVLDKYVAKGLPGISVSIQDHAGVWTGSAGMADIANNVAMEPCHISKAASITKMCVATLSMMLVEDNILSLDDKMTKWLPAEVTRGLPGADQITLFHLLSHRTGLYDVIKDNGFYLSVLNDPNRVWTQRELLEFVYNKPSEFSPGDSASYSNTNTLLASMIIESATGRSHADLLRERIFRPLGMNDTYYQGHDPLPGGRVAQGYFDLYNNNTIINISNYNTGSGNGYGGLFSTVGDLQVFINALFVNKTLLSEESVQRMLTFSPIVETGKLLGTGLMKDFLDKGPAGYAYGHRGRDLGYSADLFWFEEKKTTMALLVNYGTDANSSLRPVFQAFRSELADRIVE
jgi:D-alanyl-D-alanine carboxypeptidase